MSIDLSRTVKEEVLAAEFLVNEETMENVGSVLDALSQLGDIQQRQLRAFVDDHRATAHDLAQVRTPIDLARIGFEHWARRATHVAEGLGETVTVLGNETRSLATTLVEVWGPFVDLVRRDWGGSGTRPVT